MVRKKVSSKRKKDRKTTKSLTKSIKNINKKIEKLKTPTDWPANHENGEHVPVEQSECLHHQVCEKCSATYEAFNAKRNNPFIDKIGQFISALNPKHYVPKNIGKNLNLDSPKFKKYITICLIIVVVCVILGILVLVGLIMSGGLLFTKNRITLKLPFKLPFFKFTS